MWSNTSALASSRVRYVLRPVRSVFNDEKKLSIAALSQTLPERLIEQTTPLSAISVWNCALVYQQAGGSENCQMVPRDFVMPPF